MASSKKREAETDLRERARHLFALCDKEEKGFVARRDMQRLQSELPLEPEQLEAVFDSLDMDGNGFLTFDEFIQGFGIYMEDGADGQEEQEAQKTIVTPEEEEDDDNFMQLMDQIGAQNVFEDGEQVKQLWDHFRHQEGGNPEASLQFQRFLERVSENIQSKENEKLNIELFMRQQNETKEEEFKRLSDEMEMQIKREREMILENEKFKEAQLKNELLGQIEKKNTEIMELQLREKELREELSRVQTSDLASKNALEALSKEKRRLESQLEVQTRNAEDLRSALEQLRRESINEKRQRALAALNVTESIAMEREGLVDQLNLLRNINTRLVDENDLRSYTSGPSNSLNETNSLAHEMDQMIVDRDQVEEDDDDEDMADPTALEHLALQFNFMQKNETDRSHGESNSRKPVSLQDELSDLLQCQQQPNDADESVSKEGGRLISSSHPQSDSRLLEGMKVQSSIQSDGGQDQLSEKSIFILSNPPPTTDSYWSTTTSVTNLNQRQHNVTWTFQSMKSRPLLLQQLDSHIGYNSGQWTHHVNLAKRQPVTPSSVFKVIILGDSGVGKTSFIRRFCCDDFVGPCDSTVGIDLSVRCLPVGDDRYVALQFWDTAGKNSSQEKYRSVTRQFLRKADAIILMYDVTNDSSFVNVRHWLESINEVAEEDVVRLVVGNKTDLLVQHHDEDGTDEQQMGGVKCRRRQVSTVDGVQLARVTGGVFFEASAKSGYMVEQAIVAMAAKLQTKEDCAMEKVSLHLQVEDVDRVQEDDSGNSKKCCRM